MHVCMQVFVFFLLFVFVSVRRLSSNKLTQCDKISMGNCGCVKHGFEDIFIFFLLSVIIL